MHEIDLKRVDLNLLVAFEVLMDERSVTRAAARLGRTQSAVSHALSRLREQVSDPLLVKQGGRMTASPFAERLVEDVRPILRSIQRALVPAPPFDPKTSTRTFRVGIPDGLPALFPRFMARVRRDAPRASVDWVPEGPQTLLAVAEGQVDVAVLAATLALPEGVACEALSGESSWASFVRKGHPAITAWGRRAWSQWPHVVVRVGNPLPSPVTAAKSGARRRTVGARVPTFSDVAPVVARTDLIATFPIATLVEAIDVHELQLLPPPFPVPQMPQQFVWSSRLGSDPAIRWLRGQLVECFAELSKACQPYEARLRQAHRRRPPAASR